MYDSHVAPLKKCINILQKKRALALFSISMKDICEHVLSGIICNLF